jgi:hypothetical protein
MRVINDGSLSCTIFLQTVRHDEKCFNVIPIYPEGKELLAVVDSIANQPVNLDNVLAQFFAGVFDEVHSVKTYQVYAYPAEHIPGILRMVTYWNRMRSLMR